MGRIGAARARSGTGVAAAALAVGAAASAAGPSNPEIVSRVPGNQGADGGSYEGAVTPNARFVAFWSYATNLVQGDTNGRADIFVRDRKDGKTTRVSVTTGGTQGNGDSYYPSISKSGRYVLFLSAAGDLVPGDDNLAQDVFLHDRKTGETRRVSVAGEGTQANGDSQVYGAALSASGRYAVFRSQATNLVPGSFNGDVQVYLADLRTGMVTLVSRDADGIPGDEASYDPSVSPGGRYVAYYSRAGNILPGDPIDLAKIYVYDRKSVTTRHASVAADGGAPDGDSYDPVVSNNGRTVAFYSGATNLVAGDTNGGSDTFVRDFRAGTTRRVSVDADGNQNSGGSYNPCLSQNGKIVVFYSESPDGLVPEDTNGTGDVYSVDLVTGAIRLVSANAQGEVGDGYSYMYAPSLSSNGRWVAFTSEAANLSNQDRNGFTADEFLAPAR